MKRNHNKIGKKHLKKRIWALLVLVLMLCATTCSSVVMAANRVSKMDIRVELRKDGSARITQEWTTDVDEGTEFYLPCRYGGILSITDFWVSDDNGTYTYVDDWDVNASLEEKAGKCGIVETSEGVELCWGVSEYGENHYTLEYVLHDLVGSYTDQDGFNHRFVDEMNFFPTYVDVTIYNQDRTPLTDDVCDIWGFGFDGQIMFEDGIIHAWTNTPLESGQNVTIMVALDKGILTPLRSVGESFESVKERAFEGSDYNGGDSDEITAMEVLQFFLIILGIIVFIVVVAVIYDKIKKAKMDKRMRETNYFRDAPNDGNLNVTYELARHCDLCEDDVLLGAYLLRLICDGSLEPDSENPDADRVNLRLVHPPHTGNKKDEAFYKVLKDAAGEDGLLQAKELERYTQKNIKPLSRFINSCIKEGKDVLEQKGCISGKEYNGLGDLTKVGNEQLDEILGLKHFLLDFSLIHERGVAETVIWQDYMIYALMMGIADQVAPQIRDLYPEALPQIQRFERCMQYTGRYNTILYGAYRNHQSQAQSVRSAGSGGRTSIGGGGGFSGGGGGGVR